MSEKYVSRLILIVVVMVTMTGCGDRTETALANKGAGRPAQPSIVTVPTNRNITVLGQVDVRGWYMYVQSSGKPMAIWTSSKPACEAAANEFNVKSVDQRSQREPNKSWCVNGEWLVKALRNQQ